MLPGRGRNPYIGLVTDGVSAGYRVAAYHNFRPWQDADILHVHWPENMFRVTRSLRRRGTATLRWWNLMAAIGRVRRHGALVWTAHNLARHSPVPPAMQAAYDRRMQQFLRQVDLAVAMSADQIPLLRETFPLVAADRWRVAEHPSFRTAYSLCRSRAEVRADLAIPHDATVVAMIGRIEPYKGTIEVIRAFRAAARPVDVLLIAGRCVDEALSKQIRDEAAGAPNIRLVFSILSDIDLASFFRAADLALYNFTRILNSGSLMTALSLDCPVLAPRAAAFEELQRRVGDPQWVSLFDGRLDAPILRRTLDAIAHWHRPASPRLDEYSVEAVGEAHRRIYAEALDLRKGRRGIPIDPR